MDLKKRELIGNIITFTLIVAIILGCAVSLAVMCGGAGLLSCLN